MSSPAPNRIQQIMAERECGLIEAREIAIKEEMRAKIEAATCVDDLKPILLRLLDRT